MTLSYLPVRLEVALAILDWAETFSPFLHSLDEGWNRSFFPDIHCFMAMGFSTLRATVVGVYFLR